jgi:hypothetical protein
MRCNFDASPFSRENALFLRIFSPLRPHCGERWDALVALSAAFLRQSVIYGILGVTNRYVLNASTLSVFVTSAVRLLGAAG